MSFARTGGTDTALLRRKKTVVMNISRAGGGAVAFWLDASVHRRVAVRNLTMCFRKNPRKEIHPGGITKGKLPASANYLSAAIAALIQSRASNSPAKILPHNSTSARKTRIIDTSATSGLARPFRQYVSIFVTPPLSRLAAALAGQCQLMQSLREKSGCLFFERRTDANALKAHDRTPDCCWACWRIDTPRSAASGCRSSAEMFHICRSTAMLCAHAHTHASLSKLHTGICYPRGHAQCEIEAGRWGFHDPRSDRPLRPAECHRSRQTGRLSPPSVADPANWFWVPAARRTGQAERILSRMVCGSVFCIRFPTLNSVRWKRYRQRMRKVHRNLTSRLGGLHQRRHLLAA